MKVLIAGAGIGGLTAALALRHHGFEDVQVLEQASALREVGAGVQVGPNASKLLYRLGLQAELDRVAVAPVGTQSRNWRSGRVIRHFPLGDFYRERYGAPHLHVHRAHLHAMLAQAVGLSSIRLGACCEPGWSRSEPRSATAST